MHRAAALFALVVLSAAVPTDAHQGTRLRARMVGTEETPAIFTTGHGTFTAEVLDADTRIDFTVTWSDLSGPPAASHIHFGQRGVAGGVSFFFCGGGGKPACPQTPSGTISGTVVASDVVGPTGQGIAAGDLAAILKMIRAGLGYANMHTAAHPGGEIRGQVIVEGPGRRDADD